MKKYAVQYAYDAGVHNGFVSMRNIKIVTDTNPITYEEAVAIFNGHLEDFNYRLKEDERPELVIWEDVGDGEFPIYGTELVSLSWHDDLKYSGGRYYKTVQSEIKLPE